MLIGDLDPSNLNQIVQVTAGEPRPTKVKDVEAEPSHLASDRFLLVSVSPPKFVQHGFKSTDNVARELCLAFHEIPLTELGRRFRIFLYTSRCIPIKGYRTLLNAADAAMILRSPLWGISPITHSQSHRDEQFVHRRPMQRLQYWNWIGGDLHLRQWHQKV